MADVTKRLTTNVPGNFFVDETCINCDTCRQLAPGSFEEIGDFSAVTRQPVGDKPLLQAYQALLACPVGSIGTEQSDKVRLQAARASFPLHLEGGVYYCGFNSEKSFGANSFLVRHPDGNWLIDSPRYLKHLVEAIDRMGGLRYIFLTHEDDVADADRYARRFNAQRIIHRADAGAAPGAEWVLDGDKAIELAPDFHAIPVPGHTEGSMALQYDERFLFTGDHLWWDPETRRLESPKRLVSDEPSLIRSIARLLDHRFEWVLAGHGDRVRLPALEMQAQIKDLVMRRQASQESRILPVCGFPAQ
ncbi:MAG TPA: MBL fold metallo-hydrolase [Nitrospiraceae bacterium]|jgi:glyoxylase-like metal-dependent hydrolase (beta-lactamase superfamily II)/ferredoxin|nr:MBL fold metallo-hydrolase [Nitrospiraceae bacterium]